MNNRLIFYELQEINNEFTSIKNMPVDRVFEAFHHFFPEVFVEKPFKLIGQYINEFVSTYRKVWRIECKIAKISIYSIFYFVSYVHSDWLKKFNLNVLNKCSQAVLTVVLRFREGK